jgi:hypothetical protein
MSFIYPTNPVIGQDYTINGKSLRYNGIGFIPSPQTSDQAPDVLTEILPTDFIGGRRSVTGAEWTFETLRDNIFASGGASTVFVSTGSELESAFATEVEKINICVTKPISISGFPQSYPSQIYMTGCEVTITNSISFLSSLRISPPTLTTVYCDNVMNFTGFGDIDGNDRNAIVIMTNYRLVVRDMRNPMNGEIIIPFQITSFGSYSLDIITGSAIAIDDVNSTGIYTETVDDTLDLGQDDTSGMYLNTISVQGKHIVKTQILDSGNFTVSVLMELNDGDTGTTVMIPQNDGIILHPTFFSLTYIDSLNVGETIIEPEISFTRSDGEGETMTMFGYDSAVKGVRALYRSNDGSGNVSYELGNERGIILENGNWDFQYKAYPTITPVVGNNTTYYNLVITGQADLYHSIL